ncbi:hypothetical protein, partial [Streptomyces sp. NPDC059071]|uniref:hypothetical protein n=1 Tax=Streptomyces sp. NPDC059071 TaxID=3346714 RepID=UPI0036BAE774
SAGFTAPGRRNSKRTVMPHTALTEPASAGRRRPEPVAVQNVRYCLRSQWVNAPRIEWMEPARLRRLDERDSWVGLKNPAVTGVG